MQKPQPSEYKPYFQKYIDLVGEGGFAETLSNNMAAAMDFFRQLPEEKHNYRYAPGKWTVRM